MNQNDVTEGKTEWDLRQARLEVIGKFSQQKSMAYRQLLHEKSKENLRSFFYELRAMYKEVKMYAEKQEKGRQKELVESIEEGLDSLDEKLGEKPGLDDFDQLNDELKTFRKLDDLDDKVRELRMEVGLDIPREKEYNAENAGVSGLQ